MYRVVPPREVLCLLLQVLAVLSGKHFQTEHHGKRASPHIAFLDALLLEVEEQGFDDKSLGIDDKLFTEFTGYIYGELFDSESIENDLEHKDESNLSDTSFTGFGDALNVIWMTYLR